MIKTQTNPELLNELKFSFMEHFDSHNHYKDVDFKKGFKKPLPYLIILFILIVFSILYYLDS